MVQLSRQRNLLIDKGIIAAAFFHDLRQIPHPICRDDSCLGSTFCLVRHIPGLLFQPQYATNPVKQPVHARIVELSRHRADDGQLLVGSVPVVVVTAVLLAHVAEGVERAAFVEFVDGDKIGEIEHVDFLQLRGRTVFGSHHVQRFVGVFSNLGVRLPNTRRFHDDQIELGRLTNINGILHVTAQGQIRLPRRQ